VVENATSHELIYVAGGGVPILEREKREEVREEKKEGSQLGYWRGAGNQVRKDPFA